MLQNVAEVLAVEGATLADVVKTTVFLLDMSEFAAVNEVWVEYFTENRPTRSAVAVAALPIGARIEVEAWAYAPAWSESTGVVDGDGVGACCAPLRCARPGCQATWPKR